MNNLKPGDILTRDGVERTVIDTSLNGKVVFLLGKYGHVSSWSPIEYLSIDGWTKKEEPWVPKMGGEFWFIGERGVVYPSKWTDDSEDEDHASFLGVFPTEEAAIKRRDEIIKLIRK